MRAIGKDISCIVSLKDANNQYVLLGDEEMGNLNILDVAAVTKDKDINGGAVKISKQMGDNIATGDEVRFDPIVNMDVSCDGSLVAVSYGKSNIVDF